MAEQLVREGERAITGIAMVLMGGWNRESFSKLAHSKEAYLIVSVEGVDQLQVPVFELPDGMSMESREWYDLSHRPLPFERTRINLPAWASLRFRLKEVPDHDSDKR